MMPVVCLFMSSSQGNGSFPGSEIHYMVQKIHNELQQSTEQLSQD